MSSAREFANKILQLDRATESDLHFVFELTKLIESRDAEREKELRAELARYKAACEAGMKLIPRWQELEQDVMKQMHNDPEYTSADSYEVYGFCADELRTALKAATEGQ